ncbi:unnamed protein product [Mytilus coruscus]|uniref:SUEL-type lectin domain-containing protein n=1 Tax=Mytilus coruscus TaxID=42192 RepID=A0A6J8DKX5_MYTCO|nr:unnamed protein product [Mytilus coruscus]
MITLLFVESVCMDAEVVLQCPYRQSIVITNILYETRWKIFEWRSFNPFVCKTWTKTWNDCKTSISYQLLQDQCMWEDTCTVIMNINPCSSDPLLYATIYYTCTDSTFEPIVPLIKYYGNSVPSTTSTQNLKIGLGTALGITSLIAIIALLCILKSRRNKHEQRPNPMACSNHLTNDYDNGFENPSAYQISASNPGYSQTMLDRVNTSSDINYPLPSYEEAVGNPYEEVNYRTPNAPKGQQ